MSKIKKKNSPLKNKNDPFFLSERLYPIISTCFSRNFSVFQIFLFFFPHMSNLTNLFFRFLRISRISLNGDRTPPYIDTYLQLFLNFGYYGKNALRYENDNTFFRTACLKFAVFMAIGGKIRINPSSRRQARIYNMTAVTAVLQDEFMAFILKAEAQSLLFDTQPLLCCTLSVDMYVAASRFHSLFLLMFVCVLRSFYPSHLASMMTWHCIAHCCANCIPNQVRGNVVSLWRSFVTTELVPGCRYLC